MAESRRAALWDTLDLPVMAAPMFLCSGVELAIARCAAGIGLIEDVPTVAELVARLQRQYLAACRAPDLAQRAQAALERGA